MNLPLEVFKLVSDRLEGDGAFSRQSTVRVQNLHCKSYSMIQ